MGDTRAIESLERGIETAKSGNKLLARLHLLQAVELAPQNPTCWLWLAWVAESPASAIHSLQRVLDEDPNHELAQLGIRWATAMAEFEYQEHNAPVDNSEVVTTVEAPAADVSETSEDAHAEHAEVAEHDGEVDEQPSVDTEAVDDSTEVSESDSRDEMEIENEIENEIEAALVAEHDLSSEECSEPESCDAEIAHDTPEDVVCETDSWESEPQSSITDESENYEAELEHHDLEDQTFEPEPAESEPETERAELDDEERSSVDDSNDQSAQETVVIEEPRYSGWWQDEEHAETTTSETAGVANEDEFPAEVAEETQGGHEPQTHSEESQEEVAEDTEAWREAEPHSEASPETDHQDVAEFAETSLVEEDLVAQEIVAEDVVAEETVPEEVVAEEIVPEEVVAEEVVPEEPAEEVSVDENVPAANGSGGDFGVSVLVVDDSPTVRKLVTMTLEKNGFSVGSAADGVIALKSIAEMKPRLILLDITMPRLGGYQLCKLIKKHESTKHIPVIMLSGKDGMFDKVRGKFVGCDDYITKPFDPDVLVDKISTQLTEHYGVVGTQS